MKKILYFLIVLTIISSLGILIFTFHNSFVPMKKIGRQILQFLKQVNSDNYIDTVIDKEYKINRQMLIGEQLTSDPLSKYQWGFRLMLDGAKYYDLFRDAPRDVVVAVIDSYVGHLNHHDLENVFLDGWDFIDNDNDPSIGYDNKSPNASYLHGQCSASIIAAEHNQIGMAGIFHRAKILPIRSNFWVLDQAIRYATNNGAEVIQISGGGGKPIYPFYGEFARCPSKKLRDLYSSEAIEKLIDIDKALDIAFKKNIPVICGIGNEVGKVSSTFISGRSEVIVVGPINVLKEISPHSSFSYRYDIFAPGGDRRKVNWELLGIETPNNFIVRERFADFDDPLCAIGNNSYSFLTLGSGALPHITGAVAIIKSYLPNLDLVSIKRLFKKSSKRVNPNGTLMEGRGVYLSLKLLKETIRNSVHE